jgi:diadenosine tetraphosphate (Ap4A) HIT family hydrolase
MSTNHTTYAAAGGWNLGADWQRAHDGSGCAFCDGDTSIRESYPVEVARLRVSRWLLGANQYIHGYGLVLLDRHAIELHELDPALRASFMEDVADASRALARLLQPIKMNLEMQGNVIPHLHCHLKPRFVHDRPAHARIAQDGGHRIATREQLEELAAKLRAHR